MIPIKKVVFLLTFFLFLFDELSYSQVDKIVSRLNSSDRSYVFVAAHRGDWRNAPENSIQAIERSVAMGVDIVEIDIQQTKDGNFVLMHDKTIDRTTTGKGNVSDYTVAELKGFLLKAGHGIKTYERIPTLEEALKVCKGRILVNIDKGGDYIKQIIPVLKKTKTEKQVIIKGDYPVEKVKHDYGRTEDMLYMPVVGIDKSGAWNQLEIFLKEFTPVAVETCFKSSDLKQLSLMSEITNHGSRLWVNTLWDTLCGGHDDELALINADANWGWVLSLGTTIIQTDRPKELIEYLTRKGRRNIDSYKITKASCSGN